MGSEPLVSVIMPVYNAEKFIGRAIESLLEQDYENWELVVADDCSTDRTLDIVEKFADKRIKIIHTEENSGAAFLPRRLASETALGEWLLLLDSDDYLSGGYITRVVTRILEAKADICCGKMVVVEENGELTGEMLPKLGFDYGEIYSAEDALRATLPEWKIGLNGMICSSEVWRRGYEYYDKLGKQHYGIHDDEICHKLMLLRSEKVAFCDAVYYYRLNSCSLTHFFDERIFEYGDSIADEISIYENKFGASSDISISASIRNYGVFLGAADMYINSLPGLNYTQIVECNHKFKEWYNRIDKKLIKQKKVNRRGALINHYYLFLLSLVKVNNIFPITIKIKNLLLEKIQKRWTSSKYYLWYFLRRERGCKIREQLEGVYSGEENNCDLGEEVVCIYEGNVKAGGLADRLRGIISTYYICKTQGLDFKLYFVDPFPLQDFLVPNKYDWTIETNQISRSKSKVRMVILDTTQDGQYQFKKQEKYLKKYLWRKGYQSHVYTNAGFSYQKEYSRLFGELFKLSNRLQGALDKQLEILGSGYLSVSCRFLDLLGDFNETSGYGKPLSEDEQYALLDSVMSQLEVLHQKNPKSKILINSDSIKFLERADQLEYTYRVPGNVTHIDGKNSEYSYEKYEKTFLDFFMIANAEKIYLLKSELMHKSGYPFAASLIYNRPFEVVDI